MVLPSIDARARLCAGARLRIPVCLKHLAVRIPKNLHLSTMIAVRCSTQISAFVLLGCAGTELAWVRLETVRFASEMYVAWCCATAQEDTDVFCVQRSCCECGLLGEGLVGKIRPRLGVCMACRLRIQGTRSLVLVMGGP